MLSQDRLILTIFPENEENNLQNIDLNNSTTFAILLGKEYLLEVGYDCITRTNDDPIIFSPSLFRLQGENEIPCHDWRFECNSPHHQLPLHGNLSFKFQIFSNNTQFYGQKFRIKVVSNSQAQVVLQSPDLLIILAGLKLDLERPLDKIWWTNRLTDQKKDSFGRKKKISDRGFYELCLSLNPLITLSRIYPVTITLLYSDLTPVLLNTSKNPMIEIQPRREDVALRHNGSTGLFHVKINELSSSHQDRQFILKFEIEHAHILPFYTDPITAKSTETVPKSFKSNHNSINSTSSVVYDTNQPAVIDSQFPSLTSDPDNHFPLDQDIYDYLCSSDPDTEIGTTTRILRLTEKTFTRVKNIENRLTNIESRLIHLPLP